MLMNSKGKLFGKVSIVDIIVILLIILAIVGAYFRFNGNNVVAVNKTTEFYYTFSIKEVRETNKNLLEDSVGTAFRLSGKVSSSMGELVGVEVTDAKKIIALSDGSVVNATVPEKYDVVMTFRVDGLMSESGYFTPEMHEICVGKYYMITNINCLVNGIVEKIWVE